MTSLRTYSQPFLRGQRLSALATVANPDERRGLVCGAIGGARSEAPEPGRENDPWRPIAQTRILDQAAGPAPHRRVALVCDAGLGKTTNPQWLEATLWRGCPVWVAGRQYAFDGDWDVFRGPEWSFLRVDQCDIHRKSVSNRTTSGYHGDAGGGTAKGR